MILIVNKQNLKFLLLIPGWNIYFLAETVWFKQVTFNMSDDEMTRLEI